MFSTKALRRVFGKSPMVARVAIALLVVGALSIALVGLAKQARASGTWYVKVDGSDGDDCAMPATACAAINGALAKVGFVAGDTIKITNGMYTNTGNDVVFIDQDVTLSGGWDASFVSQTGMTTLDGQNTRRGINVNEGIVNIERFIIQNGYNSAQGGGIRNNAILNIQNSLITNNTSGWMGGGIFSFGTLSLNNSTISHNTAGSGGSGGGGGGAIQNYSGTVTIENSTISGNTIVGAFSGNAISNFGTVILKNSTVSGNSGTPTVITSEILTLIHATISNNSGLGVTANTLTLENSIIANNSGGDCQVGGTLNNIGYNVIEGNLNCTPANTDVIGIDPLVAALANNGGPTQTMALLPGSPAIGLVPSPNCLFANDQRGVARPQGTGCDSGAYEAVGDEPTATPTYTPTLTPTVTPTPTQTPSPTPGNLVKVIMKENFESTFPRNLWKVYDGWGKSDCEHNGGDYSAWAVEKMDLQCGENYPVDQKNWMFYGPFSLEKSKAADLYFRLWLNAEQGKDSLFVGASVDNKKYYGVSYTGTTGGSNAPEEAEWDATTDGLIVVPRADAMSLTQSPNVSWASAHFDLTKVYKLGNLVGRPKVWLAFVWRSDAQNTLPGGAFIDDVRLTRTKKR